MYNKMPEKPHKKAGARKNWRCRFVFSVFLLTLLPLGAWNTPFGDVSGFSAAVWLGIGLVFYAIFREALRHPSCLEAADRAGTAICRPLFESGEWAFRAMIVAVAVAVPLALNAMWFDHLPVVEDSVAQYTHARLLAQGLFSVPGHPYPEFFPMVHVIQGALWYSQYSLGHLLMLAIGHLIHMPWLICPLLSGGSALLIYLIARDHCDFRTARIAGAMAGFCPWWWFMASEFMNHNTGLFSVLLFVWALLRALDRRPLAYALPAGLGIGLALITRPLTAAAIALPFVAYAAWRLLKLPFSRWMAMSAGAAVALALVGWQLYFNQATTGDWLTFGPDVLYGDQARIGFGHTIETEAFGRYKGTTHDLWSGLGKVFNNLLGVNLYLFNWPLPSLIFVFLGLAAFRAGWFAGLMLWSWGLLSAAYVFYFYQDWCFGPRYQYEISGFLIILSAIGIARAPATLRALGWRLRRREITARLSLLLMMLYVFGGALWYFKLPRALIDGAGAPHATAWEIDAQFPDHSLVFINKSQRDDYYKDSDFMLSLFQPPLPENRVIYAKDLGKKNRLLLEYYPDRSVYMETPDGFKKIR